MPETSFTKAIERLEARFDHMEAEIANMRGIIEAWQAVKTGGQIITWTAKVATAVLGLIVFLKLGLSSLLKGG